MIVSKIQGGWFKVGPVLVQDLVKVPDANQPVRLRSIHAHNHFMFITDTGNNRVVVLNTTGAHGSAQHGQMDILTFVGSRFFF